MPTLRSFARPAIAVALASSLFAPAAHAADPKPEKPGEADESEPLEPVGFDLGNYYIKSFNEVEGTKTRLSFTLHAAVDGERADAFEKLLATREQRVRDQVIISCRLCEASDFLDPELKMFRRRIQVRLHRAVPELLIDEVYLSDFRYTVE